VTLARPALVSPSRPSGITQSLRCPACDGDAFELRVLPDDGVAAARCTACQQHFLVLDSEDHWFDLIQATSPRVRRCPCKAGTFSVSCRYVVRDDGEVRSVDLLSACTACAKTRRQMSVDIDYGDTGDLVTRPLRACKSPDLRYDLRQFTLYALPSDIAAIVDYLARAHGWNFVCWRREEGQWVRRALPPDPLREAILTGAYLHVYASPTPLSIHDDEVDTARQEATFWKRREIIRISSPYHIRGEQGQALLYYLAFANEFVDDDAVVPKSASFRASTQALVQWLGEHFVSWRGKSCFDNAAEHGRLFGDRFTRKRR